MHAASGQGYTPQGGTGFSPWYIGPAGNIHAIRNARPRTAVALRAELPGPTGILPTAVPVPTGIFSWSAPTSPRLED